MVLIYQSNDNKKNEDQKRTSVSSPLRNSHFVHISREVPINENDISDVVMNSIAQNDTQIEESVTQQGKIQNENDLLSVYMRTFLEEFKEANKFKGSEFEANINVSEVLGGLARFYEKIRTTVEYKGEHLLRRNAIERILKRLIWEKINSNPTQIRKKWQ